MGAWFKRWWALIALAAILLAAGGADYAMGSISSGSTLPSIALGSTTLLYVERAFAVFVLVLFIAIVVAGAVRGDLPKTLTIFGGSSVSYDTEARLARTVEDVKEIAGLTVSIREHERRLKDLEEKVSRAEVMSVIRRRRPRPPGAAP